MTTKTQSTDEIAEKIVFIRKKPLLVLYWHLIQFSWYIPIIWRCNAHLPSLLCHHVPKGVLFQACRRPFLCLL